MTQDKVSSQAATLSQNRDDKSVLVDLRDADVSAIVAGIVAGISGASPKTLAQLFTALGSPQQTGEAAAAASLIVEALETPGSGLTFYVVPIAQSSTPGIKDLTTGLTLTGKIARLHGLFGTLHAAGSIQVKEDTDGAGTGAASLSGAITLDANAGPEWPFQSDKRACIATSATGKHLTLVSATGAFNGYAVISLATA